MDKFILEEQIRRFLIEDIGHGDITTDAIFPADQEGRGVFVAREPMVVVGMDQVAATVFKLLDEKVRIVKTVQDGKRVDTGEVLFEIAGPVVSLLQGERVALNLVQRLCGIATLTAAFLKQVKGLSVILTDTRKTTPGLRMLEKYAVKAAGATNHRYNLSDGVLIKDNHIAACGWSIKDAVRLARSKVPHTVRIEVETEKLEQVQECLDNNVDIIMLDNMTLDTMREAVTLINGRALVEASGGVTLKTVRKIAQSGVDLISIGCLTHSAPSVDISMDWQQ